MDEYGEDQIVCPYHYFDVHGKFSEVDYLMINKNDIWDWDAEFGDFGCLEVYYE